MTLRRFAILTYSYLLTRLVSSPQVSRGQVFNLAASHDVQTIIEYISILKTMLSLMHLSTRPILVTTPTNFTEFSFFKRRKEVISRPGLVGAELVKVVWLVKIPSQGEH
jgi:hypothetical protein